MRIVYILHQLLPGNNSEIDKSALAIASCMQKNSNNVKIISYGFQDPDLYDCEMDGIIYRKYFAGQLEVIEYRLKQNPPGRNELMFDQDHNMENFAEYIIGNENPHLVHIMHTMHTGVFVRALIKLKIPYLQTITDYYLICPKINLQTSTGKLCKGPERGKECAKECPEISNSAIMKRLEHAMEIVYNARFNVVRTETVKEIYHKEYPDIDFLLVSEGLSLGGVKKDSGNEPIMIHEQEVYIYEKLYHMCL
jgi:hypothetical protein